MPIGIAISSRIILIASGRCIPYGSAKIALQKCAFHWQHNKVVLVKKKTNKEKD